jgi:hypothetical protein
VVFHGGWRDAKGGASGAEQPVWNLALRGFANQPMRRKVVSELTGKDSSKFLHARIGYHRGKTGRLNRGMEEMGKKEFLAVPSGLNYFSKLSLQMV